MVPLTVGCAETNVPHHVQFEPAIRTFEAADKTNPPPADAVLLVGSSSIRKWTNAAVHLAGHRIINRGFGGSHLSDVVAFVDRIVIPYSPKIILLYAGDNDIAARKSPERILADFDEFVSRVHIALPDCHIAYISIKPSPSRERFLGPMRRANRLIQDRITGGTQMDFIDVFTPMLDADGKPRGELFVGDRLHLNERGYQLWTGIIKPYLDHVDTR